MPLYELRDNAENRIRISEGAKAGVKTDAQSATRAIAEAIAEASREKGRTVAVAFEGWYGVDWEAVMVQVQGTGKAVGLVIDGLDANTLFKGKVALEAYKKTFISDDPGFGYVNDQGHLEDIIEPAAVRSLAAKLEQAKKGAPGAALLVYGSGSGIKDLIGGYDLKFYFDKTRQPLLWQMWDGKLASFGSPEPRKDYSWKEYYYCDFYLLEHQKNFFFGEMDYWVEGNDAAELKLVSRSAYDEIMQTLVTYPIKEVKIFQPGPWGAYRYKDFWEVPGLECNAWNELAGPELSILVDVGAGYCLNMPVTNLMQYPEAFVGPLLTKELPGMFPLDVWLDDGYFPQPEPAERISMPIHNHPSTQYVKHRFNEPLGRYETYYIAEAYEGANTWMGFHKDADLEEWERLCRESERTGKPIENWKDFIANWDSNVGDLYLIPPGTSHGHGGNQMVLEMDTVPSIAGTEYSFFMYDFCRPSWDDRKKTMTGEPVKMHNDHGFNMDQGRREDWVKDKLRAVPTVVKWTKDYHIDRYSSYGPMPFEIERIHFNERGEYNTEGRFLHISTLTVGKKVRISSLDHPERSCDIDLFQSAVIPACFGRYKVEVLEGGFSTLTMIRWKKG